MPDENTLAQAWEEQNQKDASEEDTGLEAVKQFQSKQQDHTCMMPRDMAGDVVVNNESFPVNGSLKPHQPNDFVKIAPGEGKIPDLRMRDEHMDVKAFPRHHPSGHFGLNHIREFKLSPSQYFNQRLMNEDERFSKDAFYVFMAAAFVERHGLEQQINIAGVKGKSKNLGDGKKQVSLNDMFDVFKKIKGTPKYWQTARNELVAKVKQLGPFHMFYTLSCGEMRWTEVFLSLLRRKGFNVVIPDNWNGTDSTILVEGKELWDYVNNEMSDKQHDLFKEYTFLIARLFDARVKSFIKNILLGRGKDKVEISHYSYRVEFQARGQPHIHGVSWIAKHELESRGIEGELMDNETAALKLVDELVTCSLPDDNDNLRQIVKEVQKHKDTPSCLKYNGFCRYGFPRLPSARTLLARPLEETHPEMSEEDRKALKDRATEVLERAKKLLSDDNFNEEMSLKDFITEIGAKDQTEYETFLSISERGKVLILKRTCKERNINNYNAEMITAWNANMDLQLVVDPYAVISYIASYMNKEETQTTPFLREAVFQSAGKETKERLYALRDAYISHRQVGLSEAVYKVNSNLRLKDSNLTCIFVGTGFPENRSVFFRKVRDEEGNENVEEEEDNSESESDEDTETEPPPQSTEWKIENKQGTYKEAKGVIDRYEMRPKYLEEICLAQFAISYVFASKVPKRIIFDEDGCSNEYSDRTIFDQEKNLPKYLSLKDGLGKMRLRFTPAILRIHTSKKKKGHEQQYSELLLFSNWRDEVEEFHPEDMEKCILEYNSRITKIRSNKETIYPGEGTIDILENLDMTTDRPAHIFDTLDSQRQQEADEDLAVGAVDDPEYETFGYTGNIGQESNSKHESNSNLESSKYRKIEMASDDEMKFLTRRLVAEQLDILRKVVGHCKDILKSQNNITHIVKPLRIVVLGGAGKKL